MKYAQKAGETQTGLAKRLLFIFSPTRVQKTKKAPYFIQLAIGKPLKGKNDFFKGKKKSIV